jgi:hypothetical protein
LCDLIDVECVRQALRSFRRAYFARRIVQQYAFTQQKSKERPDGRQTSLDAATRQPRRMTARGKGAHVLMVQLRPLLQAVAATPVLQGLQIAAIGLERVRGQAALTGDVTLEALEPLLRIGTHAANRFARAVAAARSAGDAHSC